MSAEALPTLLHAASCGKEHSKPQVKLAETRRQVAPASLKDVTAGFIEFALKTGGVLPECASVKDIIVKPTSIAGLLSTTGRVHISYLDCAYRRPRYALEKRAEKRALPASVIVKLQAENKSNMAVALEADNYATEARAYRILAHDMVIGTPTCFHISVDEESGNHVFVLEDLCLRKGVYGVSQFASKGCNKSQAHAVAQALGKLHAQYWSWSAALPAWLLPTNSIKARDVVGILEECGSEYCKSVYYTDLDVWMQAAVDAMMPCAKALAVVLGSGPCTLLHNDLRSDNLFWGDVASPGGVVVLDWQMIGQGVGAIDLAWFGAGSYAESGEAAHRELVESYWQSLLAAGVDGNRYTLAAAWRDYMLGIAWSFLVVMQAVKFGTPNSVLIEFVRRHTFAMATLRAFDGPFERIV